MNNINRAFQLGFEVARNQSSGSLTFLSGSSVVSASVFRSFMNYTRNPEDANYNQAYDDCYIIGYYNDLAPWGLSPMDQSQLTLDGLAVATGNTIKSIPPNNPVLLKVFLRKKN
jgi:hypothetical protein